MKNKLHPDDLGLQRFLNRTCSEHEYKRIQRHTLGCPECRFRLHAFMKIESSLEHLPLLTAPCGLEDHVMAALEEPSHASGPSPGTVRPASPHLQRWRSELVHGLIATAATFLFISSGMWSRIMSINAEQWGADVQSKVSAIETVVQHLSSQLLS